MSIFLVAYDLRNESGSQDYEPLWAELKRLGGIRTQYSLWLVNVNNTAKEVCEHFQGFVDPDDRVWVSRVRANSYWYVNAIGGTNKWLTANPPD